MSKASSQEKNSSNVVPLHKLSRVQKFEPMRINRSEIKNAPYNPRKINPFAREKLKKNLKAHGLVETLVWNKRTGNLVGGHQRLSLIDETEGDDQFSLDVSAIDVPERQEKAINILLNNFTAQGEFDQDMLASLLNSGDVTLDEIGFTRFELDGIAPGVEFHLPEDNQETAAIVADAQHTKEKLDKLKEHRKTEQAKGNARNDVEISTVLVFNTRDNAQRFASLLGLDPESKLLDGEEVLAILEGAFDSVNVEG